MNRKAFTLIELLVVVAIIGILAAVGVVAYNGYTGAAKVNVIKTFHQQTVKYITAELMKCELGHSDIFEGVRSCSSTITALNTIAVINSLKDPQVSPTVLDAINQYNSKDQAIQNSEAFIAGQVSMVAKGSSIIIRTCVKLGCATSDKITSTIVVD